MKIKKTIITISIGLIVLSPFIAYEAFLFIFHGFNPDYSKIDRCLDSGGMWDYENRVCIYEEKAGPGTDHNETSPMEFTQKTQADSLRPLHASGEGAGPEWHCRTE